MSVPAAYVGVILIWATTPLAIKWSGEGVGFLFGVTGRFALAVGACLVLLAVLRQPLPRGREARRTYLAGGASLGVAMCLTYWAAQQVPSGWVSVVFGLSPLFTGLLAARWLGEEALTPAKLVGMLLGVAGLALIFLEGRTGGASAALGVAALVVATTAHAAGAVAVKRVGSRVPALATTTGSHLVALPALAGLYGLAGAGWPEVVPGRAALGIVYLGLVGSVFGFVLYFYVLRHVEASRVALITLVTPVLALLIGHTVAGEPLPMRVWAGTAAILTGLGVYQLPRRRRPVELEAAARP